MPDTTACPTREEIVSLVHLLGVRPEDPNEPVSIGVTEVDCIYEEPVTLTRAYREIQERQADEEREEEHFGLYEPDYRGEPKPIEIHDPEADAKAARDIVTYLTERFQL